MTTNSQLEENPVVKKLREALPESLEEVGEHHGMLSVTLPPNLLTAVAKLLRRDRLLNFNFLADITALDRYPREPRFEVVYRLRSIPRPKELQLRVRISGNNPSLDTLTPIWPGAEAFEREVFDLFGIRFEGHPYLERILMPEDWQGHPLRKDYPVEGYR